ncbi:hypothetical protein ACU8V7_25975 [Zobellia nedashkovskayae]
MSDKQELRIDTILSELKQPNIDWQHVLENVISGFDCTTGTIHFLD